MRPLLALLAIAAGAEESHHRRLRIPEDTPLELRLRQTISSAESRVDERIEFEVVEDVRMGPLTVIPQGSLAWGILTAVEPKSRLRKNGKLDLDLQAVCLPNGLAAPLRAIQRGRINRRAADTGVADSVLALPALPVLMFLYGKDVVIRKGTEFAAFLAEDTQLDRATLDDPEPGACGPEAYPLRHARRLVAETPPELSVVAVRSNPEGAEIQVNGRFMGYTPATLKLQPGEHQVKLIQPGKAVWERVLAVTPGGLTNIQATLEGVVVVRR
jgi:hypothetical protein